jgi:hypothetical protein
LEERIKAQKEALEEKIKAVNNTVVALDKGYVRIMYIID